MFVVEKNIPIPNARNPNRKPPQAYPFEQMEIGDSFFIPVKDDEDYKKICQNVRYTNDYLFKGHRKVSIRHIEGGVRIWRIV